MRGEEASASARPGANSSTLDVTTRVGVNTRQFKLITKEDEYAALMQLNKGHDLK